MRHAIYALALLVLAISSAYAQSKVQTGVGKNQQGAEMQILFTCSVESPGAASAMSETVMANYVQNGAEMGGYALADHQAYCQRKSGKIANPEYVKRARLVGRKDGIAYYVIDFNPEMAVGAIGPSR